MGSGPYTPTQYFWEYPLGIWSKYGFSTFLIFLMLVKIWWTRQVLENIAPNPTVNPSDSKQNRAWKEYNYYVTEKSVKLTIKLKLGSGQKVKGGRGGPEDLKKGLLKKHDPPPPPPHFGLKVCWPTPKEGWKYTCPTPITLL